jgi:hypothetical protein
MMMGLKYPDAGQLLPTDQSPSSINLLPIQMGFFATQSHKYSLAHYA